MITKINGQLKALPNDRAVLEIPPFELEVLIPEYTRNQLRGSLDKPIALHTLVYFDGNPMQGRMVPRILGFQTEAEREFFDLFCSVDGVGSKKALRAMVCPVRDIALAIEEQDVNFLKDLPGIGAQTAERIIAKLRRKIPKFALMVTRGSDALPEDVARDVVAETLDILTGLGHSDSEARRLVDIALKGSKKKYKDSSDLLQAILFATELSNN
ncbi:MAG: Holliday junction branch migration protein RuvA [Planctomycetia bacterium]|nr:Holliday junction branch migration protein RuvA [Planctomycetia bacterium]